MKNLKKILAVVLVLAMAMALTGCVSTSASTYAELNVSAEEKNPDMSNYTNDFDGIVSYMKDCELIAGDGTDMSADFIGAVKGQKFFFTYSGVKSTCEIYEYDLENLTDEGKAILDQVKEKGYFNALDTEVKAVVSGSGKFLMVYVNSSDDEAQIKMTNRVNEKFTTFVGK